MESYYVDLTALSRSVEEPPEVSVRFSEQKLFRVVLPSGQSATLTLDPSTTVDKVLDRAFKTAFTSHKYATPTTFVFAM